MLRTRLVTSAAIAALMPLGGCSTPDDDVAETAAPTAEAASNTAAPSPEPSAAATNEPEPTPPPGFERNDDVGAQAAAQYVFDVRDFTVRTGDESVLDLLEIPEFCTYCMAIRDVTKEVHSMFPSIRGGGSTVEVLKVYAYDEHGDGYPLDVRVSEKPTEYLNSQGDVVDSDPSYINDYRIELRHDGSTWRLLNIIEADQAQ